eukprot:m.115034 g.115034  ORF g.115034 m.115034 type:complete len:295 (-) comp14188_c0_seq3:2032-2916(-)
MIESHDVSMFKFDGIGSSSGAVGSYLRDFDAARVLLDEIRRVKKEIWINLSTGTWASAFWLHHADCIWRRGHDHYFAGKGPARERWITYRDSETFKNIVQVNRLFPLSSLMLHGVIFAKDAWDLNIPNQTLHFVNDVRAAFGSGTMLQELYITPSLMSPDNWDSVAEAVMFARRMEKTLVDSHWIGGNPIKGEIYGWGAFRFKRSQGVGIATVSLTLRNPTPEAKSISLNADSVFELPVNAPRAYDMVSPYEMQRMRHLRLTAAKNTVVTLAPFEVLTFSGQEIQTESQYKKLG